MQSETIWLKKAYDPKAMRREGPTQDFLGLATTDEKIRQIDKACEKALRGEGVVPDFPYRDVEVISVREARGKTGLSQIEGQARLLHDLASIELQATELAYRTLVEYPHAPETFRNELAEIARGEARHLKLCLEGVRDLGFSWGHWPVHLGLWNAVSREDSLLDRILIVHRYLEGSGLDAGAMILRKLHGVHSPLATRIVKTIVEEEVGHVRFGTNWYRDLCRQMGLDPADDFGNRLQKLMIRIPKRFEKVDFDLRKKAGFTDQELNDLERIRCG